MMDNFLGGGGCKLLREIMSKWLLPKDWTIQIWSLLGLTLPFFDKFSFTPKDYMPANAISSCVL